LRLGMAMEGVAVAEEVDVSCLANKGGEGPLRLRVYRDPALRCYERRTTVKNRTKRNHSSLARSIAPVAAIAMALLVGLALPLRADAPPQAQPQSLERKVRHEILMQPFYTVFDNIQYTVVGDTVTLEGQVLSPGALKRDLEHSVARIPGVSKVVDNIKVMSPSPFDNSIRRAEFRTIYNGNGPLSGYGWGPVPAIHIIVIGGHVTLTGTVHRQVDKDVATLLAKTVHNVFSVDNQLTVQ